MDKKNKIFWTVMGLLVFFSILAAYLRIYVYMDYQIIAEIPCEPETESCFVSYCDPESEECSEDPVKDTRYFKFLNKKAVNYSLCNAQDPSCAKENECHENEKNCRIIYCDSEVEENCSNVQ